MINPLTVRDHFKAVFGNEPEFFLRKDAPLLSVGGEAHQEIPSDHPLYAEARATHNRIVGEIQATPHEQLSGEAWLDWQKSTKMSGNPYRKAAHVLAIEKDLKERSRPIDTPVYRGGTNPPDEELQGRSFISGTSSKSAAQAFAKQSRRVHGTGRVDEFKVGTAHGFPLSEVAGTKAVMLEGKPESEWIITNTGGQDFPRKGRKRNA